jgi:flagellar basal body-associated protein FliL
VEAGAVAHEHAEQPAEGSTETPKAKGRGLMRIIKAVAFVSVIVVVQVVVASMLAPSAKDTEKLAHELVDASHGKEEAEHEGGAKEGEAHAATHEHEEELEEVSLGTFNVTRFNPATNTTLAIDFEVYGTVLAGEAAEFEHKFEKSNARIREQVTLTLHGAESSDLTDAGLGLIKRQILEKTNRALGQPMVKEVLFSKFNFVER